MAAELDLFVKMSATLAWSFAVFVQVRHPITKGWREHKHKAHKAEGWGKLWPQASRLQGAGPSEKLCFRMDLEGGEL
jgi:hypothetical protein